MHVLALSLITTALAVTFSVGGPPVVVDSVQIVEHAGLDVAFTNTRAMPATAIVFALSRDDGTVDRLEVAGMYPQGETIHRSFANPHAGDNARVAIERVTFADGSTWNDDARAVFQ